MRKQYVFVVNVRSGSGGGIRCDGAGRVLEETENPKRGASRVAANPCDCEPRVLARNEASKSGLLGVAIDPQGSVSIEGPNGKGAATRR